MFPLFDSGYTLWAGDVDAALMDQFGVTLRSLGVQPRQMMERYYRGVSVRDALAALMLQHGLAH